MTENKNFILLKKKLKNKSDKPQRILELDEIQRLKNENFYLKNLVHKLKTFAKEHNVDLKNYANQVNLENPSEQQIFSLSEKIYVLQVLSKMHKKMQP